MRLKKFNQFKINEEFRGPEIGPEIGSKASQLEGEVTLYRLTSHPGVDMEQPGKYYVCDKAELNPYVKYDDQAREDPYIEYDDQE